MNTYYYHSDHLGSSQVVSDYAGKEYERNEYTPYGELWVEKESDTRGLLAFKFTGKELDSETGLYYYGARYMNPRTSRWVSPDPAMDEYLPLAPNNDAAKEFNRNLPGMGGVFYLVNLAIYQHSASCPTKYKDTTGRRTGPDDFETVCYPTINPLPDPVDPPKPEKPSSSTRVATPPKSPVPYATVDTQIKFAEKQRKVEAFTNIRGSPNIEVETTLKVFTFSPAQGGWLIVLRSEKAPTGGFGAEVPVPPDEILYGAKAYVKVTVVETGESFEAQVWMGQVLPGF